ncbi:MAG: AAA family ATPase [Planctomycetota bacterium]
MGVPYRQPVTGRLKDVARDKRRLFDFALLTAQASHNGKPTADIIATMRETLQDFERRNTATTYRRFTAAELDAAELELEYLVEGVLAAKHVGGIIGASKSLKTTIAADLAFSVATGGKFLGYFNVLRPARTAFMSDESGLPTLQETLRRIARAAGRELRDATGLIISDQLPTLGDAVHMTALRRFIEQDAIELLIIDPLYLCADTDGREGSLFAMGALLRSVAEVATDCGTTLLILHHMTQASAKTSANRNPELFDSSWAGTQQFFRQWIAINRRSPYDPEKAGEHELRLVTGGSMGHAAGVALDIEEGKRTDPDGRRWDITVRSLSEVAREQMTAGDTQKEQIRDTKFQADCELVRRKLEAIHPEGSTKTDLRGKCRFSTYRLDAALAELDERGAIVTCGVKVSNHKKPHAGYRLKKETDGLCPPE